MISPRIEVGATLNCIVPTKNNVAEYTIAWQMGISQMKAAKEIEAHITASNASGKRAASGLRDTSST